MSNDTSSIEVAVRIRPPTDYEFEKLPPPGFTGSSGFNGDGHLTSAPKLKPYPLRRVVVPCDDRSLTFDPPDEEASKVYETKGYFPGRKPFKDQLYIFDRVFDQDAQQIDVFEGTTKKLLDGILDGFNATVFAYGATGCGKTHTISGTDTDPGIIYLTMNELFQRIKEIESEQIVQVSVTFLEIYNEDIRDLLAEPGSYAPRGGLSLREDKSNRVIVTGLVSHTPTTAEEVKLLVLDGNTRRTQSPTHANQTSSRSHAVLQINVTQSPRTASTTECQTSATLSIIDLAGSERASATRNMGERMLEGANINKSLLALGNCINALCATGGRTRHVPYRNSKLTRLLKFSLGGNCRTVMIVCVAPTSAHYEDTQNTLKYANRAKEIKTKVSRNFLNVDRHVAQYVEAISRLNDEVAELKSKLAGRASGDNEADTRKKREAQAAALRARDEMQRRSDSASQGLVDGARGQAAVTASKLRLVAYRARLQQLDAHPTPLGSDSDKQAERSLLINLASREESIIRGAEAQMASTTRANELFESQIRSISDRRLGDDLCNDIVRLDAKVKKSELEARKAEARANSLEGTVSELSETVAALSGVIARCSVMMSDGASILKNAPADESEDIMSTVSIALTRISESNGQTLFNVLGQSVATGQGSSSLLSFNGHVPTTISRKHSPPKPVARASRRSSGVGNTSINSTISPRRVSKSRMSLTSRRQSSISITLSRPPVLPPVARVPKKAVQWRDLAGEGSLDDARTAVVPEKVYPIQEPSSGSRPGSASEMEWEDAEDAAMSTGVPESNGKQKEILPAIEEPSQPIAPPKRRVSRLDPGFLKSFGVGSKALGSLAEESPRVVRTELSDVSNKPVSRIAWAGITSLPIAGSSTPTGHAESLSGDDSVVLPSKRVPGSAVKTTRRRSGLGLAVAKARRRSSMIPTLSPNARSATAAAAIVAAATSSSTTSSSGPQRQRVAPAAVASPQRSPFKIRMGGFGQVRRASGGRLSLMGPGPARQPLKAARVGNERFAGDLSVDLGVAGGYWNNSSMATGMNYDFLYQPSSSSIHQPHVPGSDPSLATEIMPAPPPLSAFPRVNGKGQTIVRSTKNTQKKRASAIVALSPRITHAGPTSMDQEQVPPLELAENTTARKRARLSRQPSVPTSLATRASSRQLRNSPLTGDETEVTASQRAATAPITDRELSTTAPVNSGTHRRPGRPRGKKPHALASSSSSSLTPRSASLTTRDARPGPNSAVGVKSEPIDDPLLTHVDPPPEPLDPHVDGMDEIHPNVEPVPTVKIALGRRKGKGKDNVTEGGGDHEPDGQHSNNAACECCSLQGGHLVFCDGCPRSFHLLCLNPPLDELKEETWFCQTCTAKRNNIKQPPHKYKLETSSKRVNIHNLFDDLMHNLTYESPKVFTLPEDIRTHFKDVATTNAGTYMDSGDVVRERVNRHGFVEERDPYRLRDRHGGLVLCCQCGTSASSSTMDDRTHSTGDFNNRGRPIISCDYCRLHWHMDCLEPPLAVLPANGRKWMCPNHSAHSMPKIRIPKSGSRVVTITKPGQRNNGNIEIVDSEPIQLNPQVMRTAYEEVRINGQRYRVPEETIMLDFWNKAKRNKMREVSWNPPPAPLQTATPARSAQGVPSPSSSPLTSLSSLSDHEEEEEGEEDDDLPSIQDDDRQSTDDMAAAQVCSSVSFQQSAH
ncbi:kinesin motor domain protein [Rhizoctonia solani 123E]|uniref:Kinesin motor domain protein n=1 Tax=Rhizoctonia solani 123E TaxID=1423351 RepID=A0A074S6U4_9AGAM|nr:kinesin motor domain protein [Rhizoctonia solani 123E]